MIGIYKITNLINNKVYIGQSQHIEIRWKAHRSRPFQKNAQQYNSPLYQAIRKYGLKNFSFEVVEECQIDQLNQKEQYWIKYYNSSNKQFGYNLTEGGQTCTFHKLNKKEVKEIQSLLINSTLSQEEIAYKYNINQRSISYINTGSTWLDSNLNYPLRKEYIPQKNNNIRKFKKYYCMDCGKEISSNTAKRCIECSQKAARVVERPDREQLKKDIRNKSFLEIGRIYGVTDNAIRKWCKAYNLPTKKADIKKYTDIEWNKI